MLPLRWILQKSKSNPIPIAAWALALSLNAWATPVQPSSVGPASQEEAQVLWRDGKADFESGHFENAAMRLQRLVDRYPGYEGYLDAHLLLGKARLELSQPREALKPLQFYANARTSVADHLRATVLLARAQIGSGLFQEGYLSTLEIGKKWTKELGAPLMAEALILKSEALYGQKRPGRAESVLNSAEVLLDSEPTPRLVAEEQWVTMRIKLAECRKLPSRLLEDEIQAKAQIDRRGTCVLEAMIAFQKTLETGNDTYADLAMVEINSGFKAYSESCANVPSPKPKKKRTAKEQQRFRAEFDDMIEQECRGKLLSALDILKDWKSKSTPVMAARIDRVAGAIRGLNELKN